MHKVQQYVVSWIASSLADVADVDPQDISGKLILGQAKLEKVRLRLGRINDAIPPAAGLQCTGAMARSVAVSAPWYSLTPEPITVELEGIALTLEPSDPHVGLGVRVDPATRGDRGNMLEGLRTGSRFADSRKSLPQAGCGGGDDNDATTPPTTTPLSMTDSFGTCRSANSATTMGTSTESFRSCVSDVGTDAGGEGTADGQQDEPVPSSLWSWMTSAVTSLVPPPITTRSVNVSVRDVEIALITGPVTLRFHIDLVSMEFSLGDQARPREVTIRGISAEAVDSVTGATNVLLRPFQASATLSTPAPGHNIVALVVPLDVAVDVSDSSLVPLGALLSAVREQWAIPEFVRPLQFLRYERRHLAYCVASVRALVRDRRQRWNLSALYLRRRVQLLKAMQRDLRIFFAISADDEESAPGRSMRDGLLQGLLDLEEAVEYKDVVAFLQHKALRETGRPWAIAATDELVGGDASATSGGDPTTWSGSVFVKGVRLAVPCRTVLAIQAIDISGSNATAQHHRGGHPRSLSLGPNSATRGAQGSHLRVSVGDVSLLAAPPKADDESFGDGAQAAEGLDEELTLFRCAAASKNVDGTDDAAAIVVTVRVPPEAAKDRRTQVEATVATIAVGVDSAYAEAALRRARIIADGVCQLIAVHQGNDVNGTGHTAVVPLPRVVTARTAKPATTPPSVNAQLAIGAIRVTVDGWARVTVASVRAARLGTNHPTASVGRLLVDADNERALSPEHRRGRLDQMSGSTRTALLVVDHSDEQTPAASPLSAAAHAQPSRRAAVRVECDLRENEHNVSVSRVRVNITANMVGSVQELGQRSKRISVAAEELTSTFECLAPPQVPATKMVESTKVQAPTVSHSAAPTVEVTVSSARIETEQVRQSPIMVGGLHVKSRPDGAINVRLVDLILRDAATLTARRVTVDVPPSEAASAGAQPDIQVHGISLCMGLAEASVMFIDSRPRPVAEQKTSPTEPFVCGALNLGILIHSVAVPSLASLQPVTNYAGVVAADVCDVLLQALGHDGYEEFMSSVNEMSISLRTAPASLAHGGSNVTADIPLTLPTGLVGHLSLGPADAPDGEFVPLLRTALREDGSRITTIEVAGSHAWRAVACVGDAQIVATIRSVVMPSRMERPGWVALTRPDIAVPPQTVGAVDIAIVESGSELVALAVSDVAVGDGDSARQGTVADVGEIKLELNAESALSRVDAIKGTVERLQHAVSAITEPQSETATSDAPTTATATPAPSTLPSPVRPVPGSTDAPTTPPPTTAAGVPAYGTVASNVSQRTLIGTKSHPLVFGDTLASEETFIELSRCVVVAEGPGCIRVRDRTTVLFTTCAVTLGSDTAVLPSLADGVELQGSAVLILDVATVMTHARLRPGLAQTPTLLPRQRSSTTLPRHHSVRSLGDHSRRSFPGTPAARRSPVQSGFDLPAPTAAADSLAPPESTVPHLLRAVGRATIEHLQLRVSLAKGTQYVLENKQAPAFRLVAATVGVGTSHSASVAVGPFALMRRGADHGVTLLEGLSVTANATTIVNDAQTAVDDFVASVDVGLQRAVIPVVTLMEEAKPFFTLAAASDDGVGDDTPARRRRAATPLPFVALVPRRIAGTVSDLVAALATTVSGVLKVECSFAQPPCPLLVSMNEFVPLFTTELGGATASLSVDPRSGDASFSFTACPSVQVMSPGQRRWLPLLHPWSLHVTAKTRNKAGGAADVALQCGQLQLDVSRELLRIIQCSTATLTNALGGSPDAIGAPPLELVDSTGTGFQLLLEREDAEAPAAPETDHTRPFACPALQHRGYFIEAPLMGSVVLSVLGRRKTKRRPVDLQFTHVDPSTTALCYTSSVCHFGGGVSAVLRLTFTPLQQRFALHTPFLVANRMPFALSVAAPEVSEFKESMPDCAIIPAGEEAACIPFSVMDEPMLAVSALSRDGSAVGTHVFEASARTLAQLAALERVPGGVRRMTLKFKPAIGGSRTMYAYCDLFVGASGAPQLVFRPILELVNNTPVDLSFRVLTSASDADAEAGSPSTDLPAASPSRSWLSSVFNFSPSFDRQVEGTPVRSGSAVPILMHNPNHPLALVATAHGRVAVATQDDDGVSSVEAEVDVTLRSKTVPIELLQPSVELFGAAEGEGVESAEDLSIAGGGSVYIDENATVANEEALRPWELAAPQSLDCVPLVIQAQFGRAMHELVFQASDWRPLVAATPDATKDDVTIEATGDSGRLVRFTTDAVPSFWALPAELPVQARCLSASGDASDAFSVSSPEGSWVLCPTDAPDIHAAFRLLPLRRPDLPPCPRGDAMQLVPCWRLINPTESALVVTHATTADGANAVSVIVPPTSALDTARCSAVKSTWSALGFRTFDVAPNYFSVAFAPPSVATLDPSSDADLRELWDRVADAGLGISERVRVVPGTDPVNIALAMRGDDGLYEPLAASVFVHQPSAFGQMCLRFAEPVVPLVTLVNATNATLVADAADADFSVEVEPRATCAFTPKLGADCGKGVRKLRLHAAVADSSSASLEVALDAEQPTSEEQLPVTSGDVAVFVRAVRPQGGADVLQYIVVVCPATTPAKGAVLAPREANPLALLEGINLSLSVSAIDCAAKELLEVAATQGIKLKLGVLDRTSNTLEVELRGLLLRNLGHTTADEILLEPCTVSGELRDLGIEQLPKQTALRAGTAHVGVDRIVASCGDEFVLAVAHYASTLGGECSAYQRRAAQRAALAAARAKSEPGTAMLASLQAQPFFANAPLVLSVHDMRVEKVDAVLSWKRSSAGAQQLWRRALMRWLLTTVHRATLSVPPYHRVGFTGNVSALGAEIGSHCMAALRDQWQQLLTSNELFGAAAGFFGNVAAGVVDLVTRPGTDGIVGMAQGAALGTAGLLRAAIDGFTSTITTRQPATGSGETDASAGGQPMDPAAAAALGGARSPSIDSTIDGLDALSSAAESQVSSLARDGSGVGFRHARASKTHERYDTTIVAKQASWLCEDVDATLDVAASVLAQVGGEPKSPSASGAAPPTPTGGRGARLSHASFPAAIAQARGIQAAALLCPGREVLTALPADALLADIGSVITALQLRDQFIPAVQRILEHRGSDLTSASAADARLLKSLTDGSALSHHEAISSWAALVEACPNPARVPIRATEVRRLYLAHIRGAGSGIDGASSAAIPDSDLHQRSSKAAAAYARKYLNALLARSDE